MEVFYHNIYEFHKGLRDLSLCTTRKEHRQKIENRLNKEQIAYIIHEIGNGKINIYFGKAECIDIIKYFDNINLNQFTPEQDFILGTMLGYDRLIQCRRYLKNLCFSYNIAKSI